MLSKTMRALGTASTRPSGEFFLPNSGKFADPPFALSDLSELLVDMPGIDPESRDLLVQVKAVAANPLDFKERSRGTSICGYDVAGIVHAVGPACSSDLNPGDEVWYMGSVIRQGGNADYHLVDERLVSKKPKIWTFTQSAAMPLCLLTAWECLEDRLALQATPGAALPTSETILISPGAGGLGSAAIQLAKRVFNLKVVATASREETASWCKQLGADIVVSHRENLKEQMLAQGCPGEVDYILSGKLEDNMNIGGQYLEVLRPYGKVVTVDAPGVVAGLKNNFDFGPLFAKGIQILTHFVFTKPIYGVLMESQGAILEKARQLAEEGVLEPIVQTELPFTVEGLQRAHKIMEEGSGIGKVVLSKDNV